MCQDFLGCLARRGRHHGMPFTLVCLSGGLSVCLVDCLSVWWTVCLPAAPVACFFASVSVSLFSGTRRVETVYYAERVIGVTTVCPSPLSVMSVCLVDYLPGWLPVSLLLSVCLCFLVLDVSRLSRMLNAQLALTRHVLGLCPSV